MQNQHTWTNIKSSWNNGDTKTIRVPVVLADEVMQYARDLDAGNTSQLKNKIEEFIEIKRKHSSRLKKRFFTMDSTQWIVFNEFCRWLYHQKV